MEVIGFSLVVILSLGSLTLAVKRSSLATCLAVAAPKFSEIDP